MSGPYSARSEPTLVSGLHQPLMWSVGRPTSADTRERKIHRDTATEHMMRRNSTLEPTAETSDTAALGLRTARDECCPVDPLAESIGDANHATQSKRQGRRTLQVFTRLVEFGRGVGPSCC
jgi:hypothetical protein